MIGAGVHFNPFVQCGDKMIKYGVVRMQDLALDVLTWNRFYLGGRLQKPVHYLLDNWDIQKVNLVNLKAATSAALLLLPPEFTEEELYAKVCSLSYRGDLRMLFAEDKNKVKKIVQGSINSFRTMYRPFLHEYMADGLLKFSSTSGQTFKQDQGLLATSSLVSSLPSTVQSRMLTKLGGNRGSLESGGFVPQIAISSRQEAAKCTSKVLRRLVMVSSARQAVSGVLAAGGVNALCYVARKMSKAWKSRT